MELHLRCWVLEEKQKRVTKRNFVRPLFSDKGEKQMQKNDVVKVTIEDIGVNGRCRCAGVAVIQQTGHGG